MRVGEAQQRDDHLFGRCSSCDGIIKCIQRWHCCTVPDLLRHKHPVELASMRPAVADKQGTFLLLTRMALFRAN